MNLYFIGCQHWLYLKNRKRSDLYSLFGLAVYDKFTRKARNVDLFVIGTLFNEDGLSRC